MGGEGQDEGGNQIILRKFLEIILTILLLPVLVLLLASLLLYHTTLTLLVWICWCSRGKNVLLVTSESPIWREHVESQFIPRLPASTIKLNWSERRNWKWFSPAVRVIRHFGGHSEFNPMVVVFRPFRRTQIFRFWKHFQEAKHGNPLPLEDLQREMFACIPS